MKYILTLLVLHTCFVFGAVENSIVESMNQLTITDLERKLNSAQTRELVEVSPFNNQKLRVMSFNMLFNLHEPDLDPVNRWENRKSRVIDYLQWAHPDIIGSQELQTDQLDDILCQLGDVYAYYGVGQEDGVKKGDIPAVFYRKDRIEFMQGQTLYFSDTPDVVSCDPFGKKNTFVCCLFKDKSTDRQFIVVNTHLAFNTAERRYDEACKLRDFLLKKKFELPVFITGDFNTFPFRQQLDLPFYDGDQVVRTIEQSGVTDGLKIAIYGHFGPISSTNFCPETKKVFCAEGTPGVILDHIFVNQRVWVLAHGIDPAKIDGHFPSDHLPVLVDALLKP